MVPVLSPFIVPDRLEIFFCNDLAALPAFAPVGASFANASMARNVLSLIWGMLESAVTKSRMPSVRAGRADTAFCIFPPAEAMPDKEDTSATVLDEAAGASAIVDIKFLISMESIGRYVCIADRLFAEDASCTSD